ncbi:unnamed protein product [Ostreobium quekettii]|uniref:Autophagy-related protein 18 n=1 Tax=Ostreobium quekettii TaxID=121088 RepID=A0A8S1IPF5_9CHLO|nr:unnamed protein product [Ostreobium quekettii]|eukprot:evm.model.scf_1058.5 EVM.evm.TU.scf_1058.5   scf_1058:31204-37224(+)
MPLVSPATSEAGILSLSFNQDNSCVAVATLEGIRIFGTDVRRVLYSYDVGAVSLVEMLFCTSLMAFVGAGEQPALTPRKLVLMNTTSQKVIKELTFPAAILAIKMNRRRLVVVLERKAYVYELDTLSQLRVLDTPPNPKGVCTLSSGTDPCYLGLPSSSTSGVMRIYDVMVDGGNVLCEINAHKGALACLAINHDSTMIASASLKGTIIQIHSLPQAQRTLKLRRGSTPATIHCLSFSPAGVDPPLLAAAGSHGTIHVFKLEDADKSPVMTVASAAAGVLSAVTGYVVNDMIDPVRSTVSVSLPCQGVPSICAVLNTANVEDDGDQEHDSQNSPVDPESDGVMLVVATADAFLYEYRISDFRSGDGPKAVRSGECRLLGTRKPR